jgi:hypothetical protein
LLRVGNRQFFEPPRKIEKEGQREREKVLCLPRIRKSSLRKRRRRRNREREVEALVTAKATVLLPLMRKNSENNNTHPIHRQAIEKRFRKNKQAESFSFLVINRLFLSRDQYIIKSSA